MKRRIFTLAAAVSLVMCLATVGLWVREGSVTYVMPSGQLGIRSNDGAIVVGAMRGGHIGDKLGLHINDSTKDISLWWGFQYFYQRPGHSFLIAHTSPPWGERWTMYVPCWFAFVLTLALPAWWTVRRYRMEALRRAGHCLTCGYDLRTTPDRCPECGKVPRSRRSHQSSAHV